MSYDLQRIADRCDPRGLADLLGLQWRTQSPDGAWIVCPEHEDNKPSCSLTKGNGGGVRVRCFACGWSADHFGLVGAVRRLPDFRDQVEALAAMVGILEDDAHAPTPRPAPRKRPIALAVDREADRWLRGLDVRFTPEEEAEIAALTEDDITSMLSKLSELDERARDAQERRDCELGRLADEYERGLPRGA